jgi:hypothetical protein
MRSGEVEANLGRLNEWAKLPYIPEFIECKRAGSEKGRLAQVNLAFHQSEYKRLCGELQHSFESSSLPEVPRGAEALHGLLVRLRLRGPLLGGV